MKKYLNTIQKVRTLQEQGVYPGFSLAFIEGDASVTYFEGTTTTTGEKKVEDGLFYDLASVTKAFVTSTLLMQMVDRGEINLDQSMKQWFPHAKEEKVTLRHLVTHTSGLWGYIENRDALSADALIEALTQLPSTETFNTVKYTDTGFVLAGIILEKQFGKTIADLFEERIAKPLQLSASYGPIAKERAIPTAFVPSRGGLLQGVVHDPKASVLGRRCGSAGLFATMQDCMRIVQLYLNDGQLGDVTFVNPEMVQSLQKDWTPTRQAGRSLGWDLDQCQEEFFLRHTGFTGTTVLMNLNTKQAMILLTNRIHCFADTPTYNRLREEIIQIYEEEATKK